jgi:hypothetical protein
MLHNLPLNAGLDQQLTPALHTYLPIYYNLLAHIFSAKPLPSSFYQVWNEFAGPSLIIPEQPSVATIFALFDNIPSSVYLVFRIKACGSMLNAQELECVN